MERSVDRADADADQAAQDQSVPGPMPGRTEVLAHLARVLESREFRAARNRARFLEYVITRSLDGADQSLKEYTIGVDVFDRGADFDPRTDGVVRTQAGLVRKHLERYYATEGQSDLLEIVLPKGHYVPHVQRRIGTAPSPGLPADASAAAHTGASTGGPAGGVPTGAPTGVPTGAPAGQISIDDTVDRVALFASGGRLSASRRPFPSRPTSLKPVLIAVALTAIVLTGIAAATGLVRFPGATNPSAAAPDAVAGAGPSGVAASGTTARAASLDITASPIWGAFVAPGATTVLAFGIPQFFTLPGGGVWIRDTAVNSSPAAASGVAADGHVEALRRRFGALQPAEAYTGIGEAYGVYLLSRFFLGRSHDLRVVRSPTLSWDHLKHDNVIFLTSARFKTLADQLSYPSEFIHVVGTPNRVVNLHPAPGEQAEYIAEAAGTSMVDNAIISVWPGKRAGRRVLVLSGGHTWGTQAAAEYVTEGDYLRELESHLLACRRRQGLQRHPDFFQVLLRVEIRDNQPVGVRYVAHRDLAITETGEPTDLQRAALTTSPNPSALRTAPRSSR
jgi:hypothetical protein